MIQTATLTCPHCGHAETMVMPEDYCLVVHRCTGCGESLQAQPGDCCVFCSYADWPCPPRQREGADSCGSCDR